MNSPSPPDSESIEWYPIRQLLGHTEFILITLNQPIRDHSLFRDLWDSAETTIAADGGANQIYELSKEAGSGEQFKDLHTIVGDLDSLTAAAHDHFSRTRIIRDPDQYSTDFAKAVLLARREAPPGRTIVCMGGLGGRVDQGLSQVHHLYLFQQSPTYADGRLYLVSGDSLSFVLKGGRRHKVRVREPMLQVARSVRRISGDLFAKHVGIIPVGEPAVISTWGLEWDVQDWATTFGGRISTSNHVLPETEVVEVQTDKDVLFTIALKQV
ncbi:thiamine pyrophosphokinase [Hypoxylon argillaceum]|nr:thiamine pyrophosphokinase [Hypoxylon argillaceum]KAI1151522.1 thiamine pyrophosphokinase [Nemania diffusa]